MRVYERNGVREYWMVDTKNRVIEQYVLEDGRFVLSGYSQQLDKEELDSMKEKDRAEIVSTFQCTLFEDLTISVEEVFADIVQW